MTFERFVGIPWREHACDIHACDCWGLIRLVYREHLSIELPAFADYVVTDMDREAIAALIAARREGWDEIAAGSERAYDAVLIRQARIASHIGMVIAPGLMLHVSKGTPSCVERYRGGMVRHRVDGFFRYRR